MLALSDLLTATTTAQAETLILNTAASLGLPVTAWQPGGVVRSLIKVIAYVYATLTAILVIAIGGGFLETAAAGWLTLLARNVYGVERITATFASAPNALRLTNGGGGLYVIAPGDLIVSATIGGVKRTYRNTSGGTLTPGPTTTLDLDIQALESGAGSTVAPGAITTLETVLLGVTCTNTVSVIGQDEEPDSDLRERCRDKLGTLSPNGPKGAYRYYAKSATLDGTAIGVRHVRIPTPPGDGSLTVIVATDSGAVSGTVGDTTTALGVIDYDIQNNAVPEGVGPVTVQSASTLNVAVAATIYVDKAASLSDADVKAAADAALGVYLARVPIGGLIKTQGKLFVNALEAVIRSASPHIVTVNVTSPAADVTVVSTAKPVYSGPGVFAVNQIDPEA